MENEIQPSVPPVQPLPQAPNSVPSHTNWSKIILFILLGIIVVAGSIFAGIQIGKNQTPNQQLTATQPTVSPVQTTVNPTMLPTTNITADWKTYIYPVGKFLIKYPPNWELYQINESSFAFGPQKLIEANKERLSDPNVGALIGGKAWPVKIEKVTQNSYLFGSNSSGKSVVPPISDTGKEVITTKINIDGQVASLYSIKFRIDAPYINIGDIVNILVIQSNNDEYSITLSDMQYKTIFDEILSTFKFTN